MHRMCVDHTWEFYRNKNEIPIGYLVALIYKTMIIGSFVFRDDGDGCLSAKYHNQVMRSPLVESCKRTSTFHADPFEGVFFTVWIEGGTTPETAELRISRRGDVYQLTWTSNNVVVFRGQGMLYDGVLTGFYWDDEIHRIPGFNAWIHP